MLFLLISLIFMLLSFPPFNLGFLAWIALIPLLYYCQNVSPRRAWWGGLSLGFLFQLGIHLYLYTAFRFVMPPWFSALTLVGMSLFLAIYIGLFCAFTSYSFRKLSTAAQILSIPAAWVALEYIRSLGLLGHTGGFLGYTQVFHPFFLQPASVYGIWGLSFILILFQVLALCWWRALIVKEKKNHKRPSGLLAATSVFILMSLAGYFVPGFFPVKEEEDPLGFLLVQGNIPQEQILNFNSAPDNFQKYLDLTRKGSQEYDNLDLVVWPETVLSGSLARQKPDVLSITEDFVKDMGTPLMTGAMFRQENNLFNSILLFEKEGLSSKRYDKTRLVPFAEYFPFPDLINKIARTNLSLGTYAPAKERTVFTVNEKLIAGVICFESYFGSYTRNFVEKGALHIFVLSNDAWFKDTSGVVQHADAAAVRAVETGVGVTQVANTGYTISYNYKGEELFRSNLNNEETILWETHLKRRKTIFSIAGDYLPVLCLALLAYTLLVKKKQPSNGMLLS